MALRKDRMSPEEMLHEEVDTLLHGEDVPGVPFATHVNQWGSYVEGFDQPANALVIDLDSDGGCALLRVILALRSNDLVTAKALASKFFGPLEELAENAIKTRSIDEDF
ncbi:hypothetical protein OF001_U20223 [Pseudomonas sp. OF001]|uniref:hypothetical protein n=1 Tax=Pseudomonas sp. OF001 TaxID=2772300 RepID=UPI00191A57DD|nr:hypothetical protein [Pseudomonas sp. OF001]CAD5377296.1 hypothetical protein OF001_U20223 [Pseudomonas sp. OF001]